MDGNFTAQHMKMRKPEDDIPLSDGLAYMVANEPYQKHDLHIYASFASLRGQHAKTIGQSTMPILIKHTCVPLVWELLPVLIMVALFPIL